MNIKPLNIKPFFLTAGLALALSGMAHAQATGFTVSLASPFQFADAGAPVTFAGTLTNNTGYTLNLYGGSFSATYGMGTTDLSASDFSSSFFSATPVLLADSAMQTLNLFTVTLDPGVSPGDISGGSFYFSAQELDGSGNEVPNGFITTDTPDPAFTVTANGAPVPETSSATSLGLLLTLGLLGAGAAKSVRRRRSAVAE
jgi:hypothetical protein